MRKFLWLVLLLLLAQSAAFCFETKFIVLSDVHIATSAKRDDKNRQLTQSISLLQKAVKEINQSDADFVIFSGDVIDKTDKTCLVMFAKIINKLRKPYYVIPGNHDVAQFVGIDKKEFFRLVNKFSHNKTSKVPCVKTRGGLVFIFMDGVNQVIPSSAGYYKEDELIWLDKKLNRYKGRDVIIVQHFPLVEPYYRKSHMTYKADEYLKLLSKHNNVIAVISGHFHSEDENFNNGILHISAPALIETGEYKEITISRGAGENKRTIKSKVFSVQQ